MTARSWLGCLVGAGGVLGSASAVSAQRWSNADIDAWIDELENMASLADLVFGDDACSSILSSAGAGYARARDSQGVWNDRSLRATTFWNGVTSFGYDPETGESVSVKITIDPGSDNVVRTAIHEGMHASGDYTIDDVHALNDDGTILACAEAYFPL